MPSEVPPNPPTAHLPLPALVAGGPGGGREDARAAFDTVAELYDRARPGYPTEMFDDLRAHVSLAETTRVVEIGCGTGQATRVLAPLGCRIRCIELGPDLAAIARRNLSPFPNVRVDVGAFETAEIEPSSVDLLLSATAFHWIDPGYAFPRAAEILRRHGDLVLVTNAHVAGGSQQEVADEIQWLHRSLAPQVQAWAYRSEADVAALASGGGDIAAVWSRIDRCFFEPPDVSQLFAEPVVRLHPWTASYDTNTYLAMLATQSSYALLDTTTRRGIFREIARVIDDRLGGSISKAYLAVLAIASRR